MTAVTDVNRDDVGVEVIRDDRSGGSGSGGDFADGGRPRSDSLKDSVVARLLLDTRPPSLQTSVCCSTSRRSNASVDVVRGLRSFPPPVDLSSVKTVIVLVLSRPHN